MNIEMETRLLHLFYEVYFITDRVVQMCFYSYRVFFSSLRLVDVS